MTERERDRTNPDKAEDPETGEPITWLRDYGEEPEAAFLNRIRASLQRRLLAAQVAELSWFTPLLVVIEYLKFVFGFFERGSREEGDRS